MTQTVEFYSWGGVQEVTGSKHFLKINHHTILLECGAFQGHRAEADEKNRRLPFDPSEIDAVILSHAHFDHCGLLPVIIKNGYEGNIYSTPATRDLTNLILMDSAHIQAKDIEFLRKKARKKGETFDKEPLYREGDVLKTMDHFVTISYHRPFRVGDGIRVTFQDAGHILGSALVVIEVDRAGEAPVRIGFTGDLGRNGLPILRDPEPFPPLDYLICESTYGDRLHEPIENAMERLAEIINRTADRGGKIIIPAFAVERTQELIYFIHLLLDDRRIPDIPVFVDSPMATNATSIFRVHQECYDEETREAFIVHHKNPFGFNQVRYIVSEEESKKLNSLTEPAIIISSSGMCEAGRILHHLIHNIEDPRNTILIVGFMAQNTLGRKIADRLPEVKIFGEPYRLKAEVEVLKEFSAHADYQEILQFLNNQKNGSLRGIFLVHGEKEAQLHLKNFLEQKGFPEVTIPESGKVYQLPIV